MTYLIIADWDANNRPTRINTKETLEETTGLVDKLITELNCPNAFYVSDYNGMDVKYCIVNPVTKTISYDTAGETQDILDEDMQTLRDTRDRLCDEFKWRIERYNRQVRLSITQTDIVSELDTYMQTLADLPVTYADNPADVIYPDKP